MMLTAVLSAPGSPAYSRKKGEAGFSLLESLVTLLVLVQVMIGILMLFDSSNKVSRAQSDIAEMQTSQRLIQAELVSLLRSAGIGGLPQGLPPTASTGTDGVFPNGLALALRNNVETDSHIGDNSTPKIVEDTDVLILRGVFETPVYFMEPQVPLLPNGGTGRADRHTIQLRRSVDLGVEQDLEPLRQALRKALQSGSPRPEALIVRDRFNPGAYAVFQLDSTTTVIGQTGDPTLTIGLTLASGATHALAYGRMALGTTLLQGASGESLGLPGGSTIQLPQEVGTIGLLEERRLFVREVREVDTEDNTRLTPSLASARFYPNTDVLHPDGVVDLAENFIDLQIALGIDLPIAGSSPPRGDGQILDNGTEADEVLYNHPNDNDGLNSSANSIWAQPGAQLAFARVHTVVQSDRFDRDFTGMELGRVEDHDLATSIFNQGFQRQFHKQHLATMVEIRNLP